MAVKTFKENAIRNIKETTEDFNTEHGILKELKRYDVRHKMIVLDSGSFTIFTESGTPLSHALIFEPASLSLADFLVNEHRADIYSTKSTLLARLADVVDAVACLHDNLNVLHLDIKPDNILVFERGANHPDNQVYDQLVFKISNFGLARKMGTRPRKGHSDIFVPSLNPSSSSTTSATRPSGVYQGPEIQETNVSRAGRGSDVWSLGCVTLMMLAFMLYGPPGVHKLKSRLEVEFLGKDGDQSLFYITSDSYPWMKGEVEHSPYRYLQDFMPITGPVPNSELYAAVNPRVIEWSNVLYERLDGEPQQLFIKQWLEVIFCRALLIDRRQRIPARSLCATLQRIQYQWMNYENTADAQLDREYDEQRRVAPRTERDPPTSLQLPRPSTIAGDSLLPPNTVPMPLSATTRLTSPQEVDNIVLPLARASRTLPPTATPAFSNEPSAANLPTPPTSSIGVDTLRALPDQISNSGVSTPRSAHAHTSGLCLAIRENDSVAVRLMMENDPSQLRRHCADSMSTFPLHCAMKNQSYKAIEVLLEYADQSITNLQCGGRTVLEMASEKGGDPSALRLFCVFPLKFHFPDSVYRRYKGRLGVEAGIAFKELYAGIHTKDKRVNEQPLRQTNSLSSITRPALFRGARKIPEDLHDTANSETRTNRQSLRALFRRPFQTFTEGKTKQLTASGARNEISDSSQNPFRHEPISAVDTPYIGEEKPEEKHPSIEAVLSEPTDRQSLQQQSAPVASTLIRRGDSLVAPVDVLLERAPLKSGDDARDTHREPDLREISSAAFSTDGTLVGTAGRTDGSSSFSMYQHRTPSTMGLEKDRSDIASLRSRTDVSEVGSSATLVEYQHTASDVIAKAFLEKKGLSDTYDKAIKAVGIERFTRNNARLLLDLAVELRADRMLPSETLVVRLLMTGSGARLISAAICEEIEPNKGLRPQVKLEAIEDRKMILNRFLSTANAEVKPNFVQDTQPLVDDPADHKIDIPDYRRDGDAMSIASMSDADLEEVLTADPKLEDLEATIRFIMSGAPFELYQEKLRNWLGPPAPVKEAEQGPLQVEESQKEAGEDLPEDDFNPEISTSMTARDAQSDLPNSTVDAPTSQTKLCVEPKLEDRNESWEEETNIHPVAQETDPLSSADVRVRDVMDELPALFDEPNTSTIKVDAPATILQTDAIEPASGKSQEKPEPTASRNDEVRSTRLGISLWYPVKALPPTLPLLVEKILRYLPIPYFEPPIAEGKTRVRWTSGNRRRYDDFVEIDPGAAKDLEKSLKVRYRNSSLPPSADESGPGVFRFIFNVLRGQDRQQTREDTEQGPAELEMTDVAQPSTTGSEQLEADDIAEEKEVRLLLCIDNGRSRTKLEQEILRGVNNDFELFEHLHKQYFSASRWFTVRTAGTVSLVHFNVNLSKSTTVFKHDGTCTTTTREHLHASRRGYCLCIPPESRVGPEYECSPAPKVQRHPRSVPVLGPTMLLGDLMDPGQINREQRTTFLQLPKRICGELKATAEAEELGWGLHIEEGWHWPTLYCCFFTVCSSSLLFGIIWSVKRDDIQGAFAVSSYVLTLGAMFVRYMAVPRT